MTGDYQELLGHEFYKHTPACLAIAANNKQLPGQVCTKAEGQMVARTIVYSILIVCDDCETGQIWSYALRQRGIKTCVMAVIQDALCALNENSYDLVLVDICNPQLSGLNLCQQLRKELIIPILLLDIHQQDHYMLATYKAGVDEYIQKPISPALLLAKLQAWIKRTRLTPVDSLETLLVGPFVLDPFQRQLIYAGKQNFHLTDLEFRLVHLLMSNHGKTVKSSFIVNYVWGIDGDGDQLLLKNLIYRLRQKIEHEPKHPLYIHTDTGVGYRFGPVDSLNGKKQEPNFYVQYDGHKIATGRTS